MIDDCGLVGRRAVASHTGVRDAVKIKDGCRHYIRRKECLNDRVRQVRMIVGQLWIRVGLVLGYLYAGNTGIGLCSLSQDTLDSLGNSLIDLTRSVANRALPFALIRERLV